MAEPRDLKKSKTKIEMNLYQIRYLLGLMKSDIDKNRKKNIEPSQQVEQLYENLLSNC